MDEETYNKWSLRAVFGAAATALVGVGAAGVSVIAAPAILPAAGAVAVAGVTAELGVILHGAYRKALTGPHPDDAYGRWSLRCVFGAAATIVAGMAGIGIGAAVVPAIVPAAGALAVAGATMGAGAALHAIYRAAKS